MSLLDEIRSKASTDYVAFLDTHNDSISIGEFALLYGLSDIIERNETYEVQTYLADWLAIGDDGGGRALMIRLDRSTSVYLCGHGGIGSVDPQRIADSFAAWIADECPIPEE